ncbi:unnamed protein product [Camellia sinensis]
MASDEMPIPNTAIGIGAALGANMEAEDAPALPPLVDRPFDAATYRPRTYDPLSGGILRFDGLIPRINEDILLREPTEHLFADVSTEPNKRDEGYQVGRGVFRLALDLVSILMMLDSKGDF